MKKFLSLGMTAILSIALLATGISAQQGELLKVPHGINPNSKSPNFPGYALTTGGTRKTTAMNYYGGPLINTPTIYIIWYGKWDGSVSSSDTAAGQQIIRDWANSIGGTSYYQLNTSLSVSGKPISGNVLFGGETTDSGTSTSLSDANIQTIVGNALSSGRLPYNANGVYFVITSSNVNESSGFCTNYCGWHTHGTVTGFGNVRYSFVGNANRCLGSCAIQSAVSPNGNPGVDGAISVLSHELEEANTDPDINAWLDSRGQENADKCAWTFGHSQFQTPNGAWANMTFGGRNWMIQRNILKSGSDFFCMVDSTHN
jgi:hypothetical protein